MSRLQYDLYNARSLNAAADLEVPREVKAFLWTLGLVINKELRILVCASCRRGIGHKPTSIIYHLDTYHTDKGQTMHKLKPGLPEMLGKSLRGIHFADPEDVRQQEPLRTSIPGIRVYRGYWCPHGGESGRCHVTHRELSSMKQHMKKHGPGKELCPSPCDCQTLFVGSLRRFFPVSDSRPQDSTLAYRQLMEDQASKAKNPAPKHVEPFRDGELPSLVQHAQWHTWVSEFRKEPADITNLIEHPKSSVAGLDDTEEQLTKLGRISNLWMDRTYCFRNGASGTMLRYLNGLPL